MVTPLLVAVKIWVKTISMAIIIGTMAALNEGEAEVALAFVVIAVILGFFITSPLLIIYSPLVKLSSLLPYSNRSRMVCLIFFLFLFYLLFFIGMALLSVGYYDGFFKDFMTKGGVVFMLSIIVVQFIAVSTTCKSLYKLYEQF
jgi:hypothetical protein